MVIGTTKKNKAGKGVRSEGGSVLFYIEAWGRPLKRWLWRAWDPSVPILISSRLWQPFPKWSPLSLPVQSKLWQFGHFCQIHSWLHDQGSVQPKFSKPNCKLVTWGPHLSPLLSRQQNTACSSSNETGTMKEKEFYCLGGLLRKEVLVKEEP